MSEKRLMPKMFDYQKEIVENISTTTIIGNMPRDGGKDYILACKVLYERPKTCLYMANNSCKFKTLQEKFKEIFNWENQLKDYISYYSDDRNKIKIAFNNGDICEIYNYNNIKLDDNILNNETDMALYSDCLPQFNIKSKKHIAMVSISYDGLVGLYPYKLIKVYNIGLKELIKNNLTNKTWLDEHKKDSTNNNFRQEFDLFEEYEEIFNIQNDSKEKRNLNKDNFYDIQIEELMEEYADIPKNKNTTLTRENILKQIQMLQDMSMLR